MTKQDKGHAHHDHHEDDEHEKQVTDRGPEGPACIVSPENVIRDEDGR